MSMCHARFVHELADRLLPVLDAGRSLVVATAVGLDGRMPRTLGTSMAWDGSAAIGSIAGGCIEGAIVEVAERVLDDGRTRVVTFGVSDADALAVGLACGGRVDLHLALVNPADAVVGRLREGADIPFTAQGFGGGEPLFVDRVEPPTRLVVIGAMEFSAALSTAAQAAGFAVTVVDPRELFLTAERFPGAELVVAWPPGALAGLGIDARTAICHLGHDDRYDADLLEAALASPAFYVGALGSRRTTEKRRVALAERGVDDSRLHAPIGLDLGATTPAETAISILAEVLAVRAGRLPEPLRATAGRVRAV